MGGRTNIDLGFMDLKLTVSWVGVSFFFRERVDVDNWVNQKRHAVDWICNFYGWKSLFKCWFYRYTLIELLGLKDLMNVRSIGVVEGS